MTRRIALLIGIAASLAGCSSSGGSPSAPVVGAAKVYHLTGFQPAGSVRAGRPVTLSFTVTQPSGAPLVHYRTGPGPHVGVHLIIVRDDLATIIHRHPPIGRDGVIRQRVVFPSPGPYKVLIDLYPASSGPEDAELLSTRNAMRSRGPDGSGAWWSVDRRCGLGHRRLSIIDLSPAGHRTSSTTSTRCCPPSLWSTSGANSHSR